MSENVKVMVRCRPFNEKQNSKASIANIDNQLHQITISKIKGVHEQQRTFTFDQIFDMEATQTQIYEQSAFLLVQNVLEGYNGTIFAYGQTGCGKTYTMNGLKNQQQKGIIPRSFSHIITRTATQKQKQFLMHCSYIEIYNEEVYDLFEKKNKTKLEVKEAPGKGTFIKDQKLQIVKTVQDMQRLFEIGSKNRAIRQTSFNKHSSRSHCIFTVYIESSQEAQNNNLIFKAGKLNLVDLAGSERQSKIKLAGQGLKETTRINLSLSALGNVISALVDGRSQHIPYRDSKLTRLLQDSLGGNTRTVMIATISPAQSSFQQTLSTLRYASRTKFIKNKPTINEDPKDTLLREYAQQIKRLKTLLEELNANIQQQTQQNFNLMNQTQISGEKNTMTDEEKQQLLIAKQEREQLKKKLEALERILSKEEVEEDASEVQKINKLKDKLKQQKWKEQQYLIQKQKREVQLLNLETNYKSLNEEVDLLRERFNELKTKYIESQQENKDLRKQFESQKEDLLSTVRQQQLQISKYKGITEMILNKKQIDQILDRSTIDEEEQIWEIKPFLFKQNLIIFPEATNNSLAQLLRKEKNTINMFVSEDIRKNYTERSSSTLQKVQPKNTKQSFAAISQGGIPNKNRNKSLSDLKSVRDRYTFKNNQKNSLNLGNNKIGSYLAEKQKQKKTPLGPIQQKKKLNIDIGKLKMDILSELSKSKATKH